MNANRPSTSFMVLPGMKPVYTSNPDRLGERRLPGFTWLPNRVRHMFISMLGEFVGTYLFLFFAFAGTQVANTPPREADAPPNTSTLLYIALAFGFSLAVNVWIFFRISGGLFNPAVTVAFALVGAISWFKALVLIISQVLAGISAAGIVSALFPGDLAVRTTLNPNTSVVRGLFIEMLLTAELIFCIFMLAAEKHRATFLAPVGIGLCLFISLLSGLWFTGGSLNPARSFGPDVILRTFDGYHWIYWVGPFLGAIVAVIFYRLIKILEYETANPGADSDGREQDLERYRESFSSDDGENRRRIRRTDGTDETNEPTFKPPIHPINKPLRAHQSRPISSHYNAADNPMPLRSLPVRPRGGDGHESESSNSSTDHPNKRPRAQHRHSSISRRSARSSRQIPRYQGASDYSYHSGPSVESGESINSSRSST